MINDEKLKQQLLFSYNLCKLYVDTEYSVSTLSDILQISLSTIKRSLHSISNRIDAYLRLLPELGTKKELEDLQQSVDNKVFSNKKQNKWTNIEVDYFKYEKQINEIKSLYTNSYGTPIKDDMRLEIIKLRKEGFSIREIARKLGGISTSTVHSAILKDSENKAKTNKKKAAMTIINILNNGVFDLTKIQLETKLSIIEIDNIVNDANFMLKLLSIEEYENLLLKYNVTFRKAKSKDQRLIFTSRAIDYVMNSRYQPIDISLKIGAPYTFMKDLIEDKSYIDANFGQGMREKLKTKISENGLVRMKGIRSENKIEDKWHVLYLKEEIYSLDSIIFRVVNLACEYLKNEANVEYIMKMYDIPYQAIISAISTPNLEKILKPEYYTRLTQLLEYERQFNNENVVSKVKLLNKVITMLESNNYDIEEVSEKLKMPYFMLKRLLMQNIVAALYGDAVSEKINNVFRGVYGDGEINNNKRK